MKWTLSLLMLAACQVPALSGTADSGGARPRVKQSPINGPLRQSRNPNYFEDASGTPLILCGSHSWNTLQDWGANGSIQPLDFNAFVSFLKVHGHNFTLLWVTELPRFRGLPSTETAPPDFTVSPHPWMRTGPGLATDGGLKFDYPRQNRNLCLSPVNGIGSEPDPRYENFRNNLGYIVQYSRKLNLFNVTPQGSLSSTKFCLAQTPAVGAEYLVYAPSGGAFTVDLSAMANSRMLVGEWFNPAAGTVIPGDRIPAGSAAQQFTPPFSGDAVLYLVDAAGHSR